MTEKSASQLHSDMDFVTMDGIIAGAKGRSLYEHEVYALLQAAGIATPAVFFLPREGRITEKDLSGFKGDRVVLKVVSPRIIHKSDVGGVRFVSRSAEAVNGAAAEMRETLPAAFLRWSGQGGGDASLTEARVRADIHGFLVCEAVDYERLGLGSEILVGLRNTREFGPVVTMGLGGLEVEYLARRIREGQALALASAHLMEPGKTLPLLERLAFFAKVTTPFRGREALLEPGILDEVFQRFGALGRRYSPFSKEERGVLEEAEVNPFVIRGGGLVPLDGLARVSMDREVLTQRPLSRIKALLEPESIGIIGVSEKMNIGHIILNNILANGFPAEKVTVVKPEAESIEGCRCVPLVADMPRPVDLFVLTVGAEQSSAIMRDLISFEKARSVIIIAGGLGEKKGTRSLEQDIKNQIAEGRAAGRVVPVVNGANCLGVFSRPGRYDTTFVPRHKLYNLPRRKVKPVKMALISQSGAYMISRMSKLPRIEPAYAVSIGNQIDLTLSDYLHFLKDKDKVEVFAVYIEGFLPGDGLAFARAVREISALGKTVLVYKAGRSPEGKAATASHTASVAGDYPVTKAVLEQAGAFVADDIFQFETFVKGALFLADKAVRGKRVGLISNAGFECVIMSDSISGEDGLEMAVFSPETVRGIGSHLQPLGIDRLQDVKNPIDITPVADDKTFAQVAEAMLADPGVDCAVISPLPMSPAMQTLAPAPSHKEDLRGEGSTPNRLIQLFKKTDKPFVVSIDTGDPYEPMVDMLEDAGIPVFRHSDEAVFFLRRYIHFRLQKAAYTGTE
jgi:acyl-CoA synthetase (NDP forming)